MRRLISIILAPIFLCSLMFVFSSSGLTLAVYLLSLAVCLLAYSTLYLQRDLEEQLLEDLATIGDEVKALGDQASKQKEELVEFKRQVIELDARYEERISQLEEEAEEISDNRTRYRKSAPLIMVLLLGFLSVGYLHPSKDNTPEMVSRPVEISPPAPAVIPKTQQKPAKNPGAVPENVSDYILV